MTETPIKIQLVKSLSNLKPSRIIAVKGDGDSDFLLYITDKTGVPFPLRDNTGIGGIVSLSNTDGNLIITGVDNKVINVSSSLLSTINSALQSGDNISELVNDEGFINHTDLSTIQNSTNVIIQSDTGTDATINLADGISAGVTENNFTDSEKVKLSNLPTSFVTDHSDLNLDDGTNPHGTTKTDVGLPNVPNLDTTDAVNNEHTHSNKTILDNTTESFITALKTAYDNAVTWISTNGVNLINHLTNTSNPHSVTKSQVGLSDVDNISDANKPISIATQTALDLKLESVSAGTNITVDNTDPLNPIINASGGGGGTPFQGLWNAETNTPTLVDGTGTEGHEFQVSVSGYQLDDIYFTDDFIGYVNGVWVKTRDNNQDLATRYPISYINTNSGSGVQNLGEADGAENAGAINAASVVDDYLFSGFFTQNTRRFRTQALANSLTTYLNTSWGRINTNMGFYSEQVMANADVSANSTSRFFFGVSGGFVLGNTDPSATTGYAIGLAADSSDANIQIFVKTSNSPSTGFLKVDTLWSKTSLDSYSLKLFRDNSSDKVFYWVRNSTTGTEIKGMFIFTATLAILTKQYRKGSGTNAIATGFHHLLTKINTQI